ncbi:MAG: hypothetical protein JNK58_07555 [Phycisphaerae bacterium]|nr:hypothetical protein [Phycisphaerae bacterium]
MTGWAHVMTSTLGHWLPGDPRGFRDHGHRVHSSGDYKNPSPDGEHAGLHHYARSILRNEVSLTEPQRARLGKSLLEKLERMGTAVAVLAVGARHVHGLIRVGTADAVEVFGRAKQFASHQIRAEIPGKLWGASSHVERIHDGAQFVSALKYITRHRAEGAWVWENPEIATDRR